MQLCVLLIGIVLFSTIESRPSLGGVNLDGGFNVDGAGVSGGVDVIGGGGLGGHIHGGSEGHNHGGSERHIHGEGSENLSGGQGEHIHGGSEGHIHGGSKKHIHGGGSENLSGGLGEHLHGGSEGHSHGGSEKHIHGGGSANLNGGLREHIHGGSEGHNHGSSEKHIRGGGSENLDDGVERHIYVYQIPATHKHRFIVEPQEGDLHVHKIGGSHGNGNGRGDLNLHTEAKHGDLDGIKSIGASENGREEVNRNVHAKNNHQCDGLVPRITNKVKDGAIAFDNTVEGAADKLTGEGGLLNGAVRGVLDLKKEADRGIIYGVNDIACGATGIVDNAAELLDGKEKPTSAVENAAKDAVGGVGYAGEDLAGKASQGLGEATNDLIHED